MRIVAGKHRSRKIEAVPGMNTRPTLDKVKEAVFSSLGTYFDGGWFLDLFSGSGNMALEAISRGMEKAVMVDMSFDAVKTIQKNVETLKEQAACIVWKMEAKKALRQCSSFNYQFDCIYLDPPYAKKDVEVLLNKIIEFNLLKEDGVLVYECLKEDAPILIDALELYKQANYGIVRVNYYRRKS